MYHKQYVFDFTVFFWSLWVPSPWTHFPAWKYKCHYLSGLLSFYLLLLSRKVIFWLLTFENLERKIYLYLKFFFISKWRFMRKGLNAHSRMYSKLCNESYFWSWTHNEKPTWKNLLSKYTFSILISWKRQNIDDYTYSSCA